MCHCITLSTTMAIMTKLSTRPPSPCFKIFSPTEWWTSCRGGYVMCAVGVSSKDVWDHSWSSIESRSRNSFPFSFSAAKPFSDLFEEAGLHGDPFNERFPPVAGLNNVYGIPKPSYRAFQLMHWTGSKIVSTSPDFLSHPTVGVFAVTGNMTSIFVVNWNVHNQPIKAEKLSLTVQGVSLNATAAVIYRIDSTHASAIPTWISMGRPFYLSPMQVRTLRMASELIPEPVPISSRNPEGGAVFELTIPPYAVYNVVV